MQYRSSFQGRRRPARAGGVIVASGLAILVIAGLFAYGIWWFRFRPKTTLDATPTNTIENVMSPASISAADLAATVAGTSREAALRDVSGGNASGTAFRDTVDGRFVVRFELSVPEIDRNALAYEGWLIRQVPYDFISIGDVITNDDGGWVLEWSGAPGTLDGYSRVVVTRELKDGNPDPAGHVLEGEFE